MPVKAKSWGYIYILRCIHRYKIGYSGNLATLAKRIRRLQNMNAYDVEIALLLCHRNAHRVEVKLHLQYDEYRKNGEWFELPEGTIETIKANYEKYIYRGYLS